MFWQFTAPCCQLEMDALQLGGELPWTRVKASFGVYGAENVTQNDGKLAEISEGGDAVCWRAQVSGIRLRRVCKRCPMFKLFVRVLKLDGHKGIGLFDSDRSSLI